MTDRWLDYFAKQGAFQNGWLRAAVTHWGFHEVLYGTIQRHCPPPARVLDVGCGPGWSDCYLAAAGYTVSGIDNEPRLVANAKELAQRLRVNVEFAVGDAFDLSAYHNRFDLAYSCGVLEHFDRNVTIQLLQEQAKCAPLVLIQVPTRYTSYTGPVTDERIYTMRELKEIVKAAGLSVVTAVGYGDVTVTSVQIWARRMLPRAVWRWLQNQGVLAYSMAVLGLRKG